TLRETCKSNFPLLVATVHDDHYPLVFLITEIDIDVILRYVMGHFSMLQRTASLSVLCQRADVVKHLIFFVCTSRCGRLIDFVAGKSGCGVSCEKAVLPAESLHDDFCAVRRLQNPTICRQPAESACIFFVRLCFR